MYRSSTSIPMNLQGPSSMNSSILYNLQQQQQQANLNNLAKPARKAPSALNAGMIDRVFNVRPGCGSCGK
uniref:Uncharacterized protein n=1 Tax=viral metagenome TaxID=1070528 RepID=A0A6C0DJ23_9ZZZZ